MRSARRANAAVGLNGMLMALVMGVSCVRSQRTLQPTPEPSLRTCRSGTGTSFTVDEPNADTPILVLHTPYAGFSQVSPLPTFVVWRNGDVLFTVKDGAGDFRTQMGHLDPETAIALVADVVQQLDGEPAFQEPRPSITDQPMNRLFAFSDDAWRSWSVYGWWSDELVNSATLEAEYREFLNQERALEERCETIGAMNLNRVECIGPRQPPPAKFAAVYRQLTTMPLKPQGNFAPARFTVSFFDAWQTRRVYLHWPDALAAPPAMSPAHCSLAVDGAQACSFDLAPSDNFAVKRFVTAMQRAGKKRGDSVLRSSSGSWNFYFTAEYRGERDMWQVQSCATKLGITQER